MPRLSCALCAGRPACRDPARSGHGRLASAWEATALRCSAPPSTDTDSVLLNAASSLTMAPRWSVEETQALLEAWAPVHQRRLQAQGDPWVRPQRRRSSLNLVAEDWREIADAVNNRRARANQTAERCKSRMKYLRSRYAVELLEKPSTWKLFDVVAPFFDPLLKPKGGVPSSAAADADAAEEDGDPAAEEEEDGGPAAAGRGNDSEAAGSRAAAGTARTSVQVLLLRMTEMCERVMLKWLENDAAEKAMQAGTSSSGRS